MFGKAGRKFILDFFFNNISSFGNIQVALATNVPGGDEGDWVVGDFSECDFPGYSAIVNPDFAAADLDGSNRGRIVSPVLTWVAGTIVTPQTIRAIYVHWISSGTGAGNFLWAKALSPTVTIAETAQEFKRQLTFLTNDFTP